MIRIAETSISSFLHAGDFDIAWISSEMKIIQHAQRNNWSSWGIDAQDLRTCVKAFLFLFHPKNYYKLLLQL